MARADVGIVGAGLAGLAAAIGLAETGARVHVLAAGHTATHWTPATVDVGIAAGADTPAEAVSRLARRPGHPYGLVSPILPEALHWLRATLAESGLELVGELTDPIRAIPTSIGATRPAAIVPDGMAAALPPWEPDETLVVLGPAGFRDFWPEAIAASLRDPASWRGQSPPRRIEAVTMELPTLAGRHNLSGLDLARAFDDSDWRDRALDSIARALERLKLGAGRVALPAVLGLDDHPAVLAAARARLPLLPFEVGLVPPSVPGLRRYRALRESLRRRSGRLQVGEPVRGSIGTDRRVSELSSPAAARRFSLSVGSVVLATGGIAGGGLAGPDDGSLVETVLGLPVEGPGAGRWLAIDPFDPAGHPLEAAGVRTDGHLRPVARGTDGPPVADNVRIVGSLLAGQRYLREQCGEGVAIASGRMAALELAGTTPAARSTVPAAAVPSGRL